MSIIRTIQRQFDRAALVYDEFALCQQRVCQDLLAQMKLSSPPYPTVLELGCGTGVSTQALLSHFPDVHLTAVDCSLPSLRQAQRKTRQVDYILANFEQLPFKPQAKWDLIFSNMSFQWSTDFFLLLQRLASHLQPGGQIAFTLPLEGTFHELKPPYRLDFLTYDHIIHSLKASGLTGIDSKLKIYQYHFHSPLSALRSLKKTGSNLNLKSKPAQGLNSVNLASFFCDNISVYSLSYHIGLFWFQQDSRCVIPQSLGTPNKKVFKAI